MEAIIGIDLGTTNSAVAVCVDNKIEVLKLEQDALTLPSVVALDDEGQIIVGTAARNQQILYPERTISSIKRKMGSEEKFSLGEKTFLAQEISAFILLSLKQAAEKRLGQKVTKAVITVPAQFTDVQRQATRDAGRIAGLEVLRILNEPTAACLAYDNLLPGEKKTLLAFDLGGGTFDVSVVQSENEIMEVIASSGDNLLGGDDFDKAIADMLLESLYEGRAEKPTLQKQAQMRLQRAAENAKIQLSQFSYAQILEANLLAENDLEFSLDRELARAQFDDLMQSFVDKAMLSVRTCLTLAEIKAEDIDELIMVGGSTRNLIFQDTLEEEFKKRPHTDIDPDLAVVYGAGVMAARLMGSKEQKILLDITPYTFGVSYYGVLNGQEGPHCFKKIIKAGSPLPIMREEEFYTMSDKQKVAAINIFQGEDPDARNNILVGNFTIDNLKEVDAGNRLVFALSLDLNGVLHCSATEKISGNNKSLSISNVLTQLTEEELQASAAKIQELFDADDFSEFSPPIPEELLEEFDEDTLKTANTSELGLLSAISERLENASDELDEYDKSDAQDMLNKMKEAIQQDDQEAFQEAYDELDYLLFFAGM
jgi:molecular chaperone DnaK